MFDSLAGGYAPPAAPTEVDDLSEFELDMNRFQKKKQLSEGGFGTVFLARDVYTDWLVVIKEMHQSLQVSARDLEFFKREISILVKTHDHPFVLQCYGFSREMPCSIVTAYMRAGSLWDIVHSDGGNRLTETQKNCIATGIAHGMRYLHSCNIVHRDLKSPNILLDNRGLPKIADFGLSRFTSVDGASLMTQCIGTAQWMAPEQIGGEYGPPVDVFAYGMILYEMLTGEVPYDERRGNQGTLLTDIADGYRPPLEPTGSIEKLILQCWDQDPDQRPTFDEIYHWFINGTVKFRGSSSTGTRQFMRVALTGGDYEALDIVDDLAHHVNAAYKTAAKLQGRIKDVPNLLCYYAEKGMVRDICRIIESVDIDINATSSDGRTPLFCAAYFGQTEVIDLFIELHGIDVNKSDRNGHTPLMAAARQGHVVSMLSLLDAPTINVNAIDNEGRTALHIAVLAHMRDIVYWLLKVPGLLTSTPSKDGKTPLDIANERGFADIVDLFKQSNACCFTTPDSL